jgi:hypothetical protein
VLVGDAHGGGGGGGRPWVTTCVFLRVARVGREEADEEAERLFC